MAKRPIGTFAANTEMNSKEKCKVIFTRREIVEKEKRIEEDVHDEKVKKGRRRRKESSWSKKPEEMCRKVF